MKTLREDTMKLENTDTTGRPILMKSEDLKEKLRQADAECLIRRYSKVTGRVLNDRQRKRLEGIAYRSLCAGKTEADTLTELRKVVL